MTERITRTYEVQWELRQPWHSQQTEDATYVTIDAVIDAVREALLDSSSSYRHVEITRREVEVTDG